MGFIWQKYKKNMEYLPIPNISTSFGFAEVTLSRKSSNKFGFSLDFL